MKALDINSSIVDGYLKLLDNLSPDNKLYIISRLALSVKSDIVDWKTNFKKSFGAFESKKSANAIIKELKNYRNKRN